jgi:capsular exopolysaccharide synthesis family protein
MSESTNQTPGKNGDDQPTVGGHPLPAALLSGPAFPAVHQPMTVRLPSQGEFGSVDQEAASSGVGLVGYLHALRRHWALAILAGLFCGALAAGGMWLLAEPTYTATALLYIAAENNDLVFPIKSNDGGFEIYKGTQVQLLTSDGVLTAALRKIHDLDILKREDDPVRWLAKALRVDTGNTEIIRVSLTTKDKNDSATLVQAVVDAYKTGVVDVERLRRAKRLNDLDNIYTEKSAEIRKRRTELKNLTEQLGTGDPSALAVKQQMAMQDFMEAKAEQTRVEGELRTAVEEAKTKFAAYQNKGKEASSSTALQSVADLDPVYVKLQENLTGLGNQYASGISVVKPGSAQARAQRESYERSRAAIEEQLDARRNLLVERLQTTKQAERAALEVELKQLLGKVEQLKEQQKQVVKDFESKKKIATTFGTSSIDVEMMHNGIQELERVLGTIADERQHLQVEANAQARIRVIQPATPPQAPDKSYQTQNSVVAGIFGMLASVGLLLWWDVRARRINSLSDVSGGLGLTVVGTMPQMPEEMVVGKRVKSRRHRRLQACLEHSVDGIAARLFLNRSSKNARIVLVSSATRGEGKTVLSIQLARCLARTGSKTLLVDFDLRRPSLHQRLGAERGPGLTELLSGRGDLANVVQPTETPNLSILTTGAAVTDYLGALSNGVTRSLFEKARSEYEFVIVDGSPILPTADALLVSQHVDVVVLSVRRDVSQSPKVQAACEHLTAYGVEKFVAVLTGSEEDLYEADEHDHVLQANVAADLEPAEAG